MSTINKSALQALTATLQSLKQAVVELETLDSTEKRPTDRLYWLEINNRRQAQTDEIDRRLIQSMEAAAKRRAAEMGAILRAEALEKATDEIERLRAVLCQQAAAATIELAAITRDARERG